MTRRKVIFIYKGHLSLLQPKNTSEFFVSIVFQLMHELTALAEKDVPKNSIDAWHLATAIFTNILFEKTSRNESKLISLISKNNLFSIYFTKDIFPFETCCLRNTCFDLVQLITVALLSKWLFMFWVVKSSSSISQEGFRQQAVLFEI